MCHLSFSHRARHVALLATLLFAGMVTSLRAHPQQNLLALAVTINGHDTGLIGTFAQLPTGELAATRQELGELGLRASDGPDDELIPLAALDNVTYRYIVERQEVTIVANNNQLKQQNIGPQAATLQDDDSVMRSGLVLNYSFDALTQEAEDDQRYVTPFFFETPTVAVGLESRFFGLYGTISNEVVLRSSFDGDDDHVRLNSSWAMADTTDARMHVVGDFISAGPSWTRAVRLGGIQSRTDYDLRPDIISTPQPSLSGSAAAPSSVEVFINNTRAYNGSVRPGPFVVSGMPVVTGAGNARIVVRDPSGRETVQTTSFYTSPKMLRGGLYEHAVNIGVARREYGFASNSYDSQLVGSASLRHGYSNNMTLEAHTEVAPTLINAGAGMVTSVFDSAVLSIAASASNHREQWGFQAYAGLETKIGPATLKLSSKRTFGSFHDLASVTSLSNASTNSVWYTSQPLRALDIASMSLPLEPLAANLSFSFVNFESADYKSQLLAATVSRPLSNATSLMVSGNYDLETSDGTLFANVSMSFGNNTYGSLGVSSDGKKYLPTATYARTATEEPGSIGYRVAHRAADGSSTTGALTYQTSAGRFSAGAEHHADLWRTSFQGDGAVVLTSDGTFFTNRIYDSFAVVDVGEPQVPVRLENRTVAYTNENGVALVQGLRSNQKNRLSIDPQFLPVDAVVPETDLIAVPPHGGAVAVKLQAERKVRTAIVQFLRQDGKSVPAGAQGSILETGETFVVGYDGQAYFEGLTDTTTVAITINSSSCSAQIIYPADLPPYGFIEGVICA